MAKFCSNCGKQLKEGAKFCSGCGKKLTVSTSNSSAITNDTLLAGAGAIGTAIATTQETANAQTANITNATATPPSNEILSCVGKSVRQRYVVCKVEHRNHVL